MALSTLRHSEVVAEEMKKIYATDECWYNASINLLNLEAKYDRKMKLVIGSRYYLINDRKLSMCGSDESDEQRIRFMKREKLKNPNITNDELFELSIKEALSGQYTQLSLSGLKKDYQNSHGWVEDEYGNVWDYVFEEGKTIKAGFINGVHRSKLFEMGYVLKAFNEESQKFVLKCVYAYSRCMIEKLKFIPPDFEVPNKKRLIKEYEALKSVLGY